MHNIAVLRLLDGGLHCYPPGAAEQPLVLDTDAARQSLRDTLVAQRWGLCFAVPSAALRLLTLEVPADEKKHLAQALPFTLEEQVAEDVDELHFAFAPLSSPFGNRYAVGLCRREDMADWQAQLADFGQLSQWLPEALLLPWREGEWCLLLEGERAVVRSGECGGFACERELLPLLLEAALAEAESGDGQEPGALVVYGADQAADLALVPEALRARCQWRRGNLCSALLLVDALPGLNLLQGAFAPRLPLARWWREWRLVAVVLAAVFCLQLLSTWLDYRALSRQNLELRTAREASYRQAYPQGAVVDPEKQLQRQLDALRGTGGGSGFVPLLDRVGRVLVAEPGTRLASLNYSDRSGDMRMNLVARDYESVERVRAGINAGGLSATMESSSAQGEGVRARLRVEARG
ncbi:MAG: type II secretion system protein GspL [Parahaliea sp.]